MWWIYMNASHIFLLWYGFTLMPHYTIAFKPVFELIILGIIPGTNIRMDMSGTLILAVTSLLVLFIALNYSKRKSIEPFSTIYDISL
jgi:hypothetical protein